MGCCSARVTVDSGFGLRISFGLRSSGFGSLGVALWWLWGGSVLPSRWLCGGLVVALGWLCTPESVPSLCLVYGFLVAALCILPSAFACGWLCPVFLHSGFCGRDTCLVHCLEGADRKIRDRNISVLHLSVSFSCSRAAFPAPQIRLAFFRRGISCG